MSKIMVKEVSAVEAVRLKAGFAARRAAAAVLRRPAPVWEHERIEGPVGVSRLKADHLVRTLVARRTKKPLPTWEYGVIGTNGEHHKPWI
ncbi:hypothetical protein [Streptomyces lunalinharesii]|uniref:Uncharacterized protein n=1 Tax=Streptomyces lunalinharesii TaxID=333384 RepID=A0ABP6F5V0_9ACTN